MADFVAGNSTLLLSEPTIRELENAPAAVRDVLRDVPEKHIETLAITIDAEELADAYIREGVVGQKMRVDALHIALATIARVDVLVSWNFQHTVNLRRIHSYNAVNLKFGFPMLEIRSPREVLESDSGN